MEATEKVDIEEEVEKDVQEISVMVWYGYGSKNEMILLKIRVWKLLKK